MIYLETRGCTHSLYESNGRFASQECIKPFCEIARSGGYLLNHLIITDRIFYSIKLIDCLLEYISKSYFEFKYHCFIIVL